MKYKKIKKFKGLFKIGYALMNFDNQKSVVHGDNNALVVRSKVSDFEYKKGYTPVEVVFEHIIMMMSSVKDVYYAFDFESLKLFLSKLKSEMKEIYDGNDFSELENWKPKVENEVVVLNIPLYDALHNPIKDINYN